MTAEFIWQDTKKKRLRDREKLAGRTINGGNQAYIITQFKDGKIFGRGLLNNVPNAIIRRKLRNRETKKAKLSVDHTKY